MAYESFVGRRYLMAKKRSRVVSIITLIAVGGVALGVTALIVVLSVMGGFTSDLTEKILGARAHVVVQMEDQGPLDDPESLVEHALSVDRVVGASPFVETEVMVSSASNLGGVVLRGIDVDRIGNVSDLVLQIEEGDVEFLRDEQALERYLDHRSQGSIDGLFQGKSPGGRGALPVPDLDEDGVPALPSLPDRSAPLPHESVEREPPPSADMAEVLAPPDAPPEMPSLEPVPLDDLSQEVESDDEGLPPLPRFDDDEEGYGEGTVSPGAIPPLFDSERVGQSRVPGLIIGTELANSLQVSVGDEINVVTPRGEMGPTGPIPRSRPYRVVAIFYSGMYEYDANHAYTNLPDALNLMEVQGPTGVEIRAADVGDAVGIADQLREELGPSLQVLDWQELNSSLFFALRLERIAMFVVLTFIILVASFSIVAMLIMIVIEKAREIAILKSMGANNLGIMGIFIYQGLVIGISGAALGLAAGLGICHYLATEGIPLDSEVYYIATLPVDVNPVEVTAVVCAAVIISFLATIYPSLQAARLNPVEGLSYD